MHNLELQVSKLVGIVTDGVPFMLVSKMVWCLFLKSPLHYPSTKPNWHNFGI